LAAVPHFSTQLKENAMFEFLFRILSALSELSITVENAWRKMFKSTDVPNTTYGWDDDDGDISEQELWELYRDPLEDVRRSS